MKTKIIFYVLFFTSIGPVRISGQENHENTTDRILEGGNIIVEILKIVDKKSAYKSKEREVTEADCATKNFTNICFINKSKTTINVLLKPKTDGKILELVICEEGRECCYQITPGVYSYSLTRSDPPEEKPFRKGDILLEVCNDVEVKIK